MPTATKTTKPAASKATPAKRTSAAKKAAAVRKAAAVKKATKATPMNGKDPLAPTRTPMKMSDEHKASLAEGRDQGRTVRRYLEALSAAKPKRGRQRTPESIRKRLTAIQAAMPSADPMLKLSLIQERMDLDAELAAKDQAVDLSELEAGFVEVAASYAGRKGYSYAAFVELGVPPKVLERAGIRRS